MKVFVTVRFTSLFLTIFCFSYSRLSSRSHTCQLSRSPRDFRFGSFNLSPTRFLKSWRNSRFLDIHTKIFKLTSNFVFIQARFSNYYQIKSVTLKKSKHCKKDDGQFRASSVKEKEILCKIQRFVM